MSAATGTWVIARKEAKAGAPIDTAYWSGGVVFANTLSIDTRSFGTKGAAVNAFRQEQRMTKQYYAKQLSAKEEEQVALAPPSAPGEPSEAASTDVAVSGEVEGELVADDLTADEAREVIDKIRTHLDDIWESIKLAYNRRAWIALGYASWDDYTATEFDTSHLRIPLEERGSVVSSLTAEGMSTRAIAAATGMSKDTVHRVQKKEEEKPTVSDETVPSAEKPASKNKGKVISLDGRLRPAKRPKRDVPQPTTAKKPWLVNRFCGLASAMAINAQQLEQCCIHGDFAKHVDELHREALENVVYAYNSLNRTAAELDRCATAPIQFDTDDGGDDE